MKKLTALDLQNVLDECAEKKFKTHGDWLAGMVNRLNSALTDNPEFLTNLGNSLHRKKDPFKLPPINTTITTGNVVEPEVPCIS